MKDKKLELERGDIFYYDRDKINEFIVLYKPGEKSKNAFSIDKYYVRLVKDLSSSFTPCTLHKSSVEKCTIIGKYDKPFNDEDVISGFNIVEVSYSNNEIKNYNCNCGGPKNHVPNGIWCRL